MTDKYDEQAAELKSGVLEEWLQERCADNWPSPTPDPAAAIASALRTCAAEAYDRGRSDVIGAWSSEGDAPLPEDAAIEAAHPLQTVRHDLYSEALRLVGARKSKGGLVELVNWLLAERDAALDAHADYSGSMSDCLRNCETCARTWMIVEDADPFAEVCPFCAAADLRTAEAWCERAIAEWQAADEALRLPLVREKPGWVEWKRHRAVVEERDAALAAQRDLQVDAESSEKSLEDRLDNAERERDEARREVEEANAAGWKLYDEARTECRAAIARADSLHTALCAVRHALPCDPLDVDVGAAVEALAKRVAQAEGERDAAMAAIRKMRAVIDFRLEDASDRLHAVDRIVRDAITDAAISDFRADETRRAAALSAPAEVGPARCDECDPSFGCFNGSAPCPKRPT